MSNCQSVDCQYAVVSQVQSKQKDEEEEVGVVSVANAIVQVWAMVVKPLHSFIANVAMSAPRGSDHLTVWTKVVRAQSF